MSQLILILLCSLGLIILGGRVVAIGSASGLYNKWVAFKKCCLDWTLSLGLAFIGGMTGGVMGGAAGLVAGPVVSYLVSRNNGKEENKNVKSNEKQEVKPDIPCGVGLW